MKFLKEFNDDGMVFDDPRKVRNTARAFVIDKSNKIALLSYAGEFRGEKFSFHATPGGGMEGDETPQMAVKREVLEEIGYQCNILHEVGTIIDYYPDKLRKTITNYFIVEPTEKSCINWTENEKQNLKGVKWVEIETAKEILSDMPKDLIGRVIQRRDLYALEEVKKIMKL